MKLTAGAGLLLLLVALCAGNTAATRRASSSGRVAAAAAGFGPGGCVSLQRSAPPPQGKGSCVLHLDCEGRDISQVEFSFDCESAADGGIVRHSFGRGGFDPDEEFDTEVQCDRCLLPLDQLQRPEPPPQHLPAHPDQQQRSAQPPMPALPHLAVWRGGDGDEKQRNASTSLPLLVAHESKRAKSKKGSSETLLPPTSSAKTEEVMSPPGHEEQGEGGRGGGRGAVDDNAEQQEQAAVVRYGPNQCVSTYRSRSSGHCIMETHCSAEAIQNYSFGLVCVDKVGVPVRHVFGKNSFDPVESFDTLVACHECLGLEDIPDSVAMNSQVLALVREIRGLEATLHGLARDVSRLDAQAGAAQTGFPTPADAAAAPPAGVAPPPAQRGAPSPAPPPPTAPATALLRWPGGGPRRRQRQHTAGAAGSGGEGTSSFFRGGATRGEVARHHHRRAARLAALAAEVEREAEVEEEAEEDGEDGEEQQPNSNEGPGSREEGEPDEEDGT